MPHLSPWLRDQEIAPTRSASHVALSGGLDLERGLSLIYIGCSGKDIIPDTRMLPPGRGFSCICSPPNDARETLLEHKHVTLLPINAFAALFCFSFARNKSILGR